MSFSHVRAVISVQDCHIVMIMMEVIMKGNKILQNYIFACFIILTTQSLCPNVLQHQNINTASGSFWCMCCESAWSAGGLSDSLWLVFSSPSVLQRYLYRRRILKIYRPPSLFVNGDTLDKNAQKGHSCAGAGGWWSVCSDPCLITLWTRVARC